MKFTLVDKEFRAIKEWTPEQDAEVETIIKTVFEWIRSSDEIRSDVIKRAYQISSERPLSTGTEELATMAWAIWASIHQLQKQINTRNRQRERNKVRNPQEWCKLRYEVLAQRGNRCECCGRSPPDVVIHVDHIKPVSKHPALALDPDNLQILCQDCNFGKSAIDETDWRK